LPALVTLTPAGGNRIFVVSIGCDDNNNRSLDAPAEVTQSLTVTVVKVVLSPDPVNVCAGLTAHAQAVILPPQAFNIVGFATSDPNVVTVVPVVATQSPETLTLTANPASAGGAALLTAHLLAAGIPVNPPCASARVFVGDLEITSLEPADILELGKDLTVNYRIAPEGFSFDDAELQVFNAANQLIFKKGGIPKVAGTHSETWEKAQWNRPPHAGAYANPKNGPYKVRILGLINNGDSCVSNVKEIATVLKITLDIEDPQGAPDPADRAGIAETQHKLASKRGAQEQEYATAVTPGPDHTRAQLKSADPALNSLDDGVYDFTIKDFRDDIGNFADPKTNSFKLELQ